MALIRPIGMKWTKDHLYHLDHHVHPSNYRIERIVDDKHNYGYQRMQHEGIIHTVKLVF